jgi:hydroxymethylbilane synthase
MKYKMLKEMPEGSCIGTSSLRRAAQIAERHPRLEARLLRGNVETRLAKLDRGEYDAVILAAAGLIRLGLEARIASRLALEESLPAPGQGALGIECVEARADVAQIVRSLNQEAAARCVRAERAVSRALGGSCSLPLGAHAELKGDALLLRGLVASADGRRVLRAQAEGADPEALGAAVASDLRRQGADEILKAS